MEGGVEEREKWREGWNREREREMEGGVEEREKWREREREMKRETE